MQSRATSGQGSQKLDIPRLSASSPAASPGGHQGALSKVISSGRRKTTGATVGGAPFWGPIFGGLSQSTPYTLGIEILGIDRGAWLLPPGFIQPTGIDTIKAQFID
jgi:hypothetical protein